MDSSVQETTKKVREPDIESDGGNFSSVVQQQQEQQLLLDPGDKLTSNNQQLQLDSSPRSAKQRDDRSTLSNQAKLKDKLGGIQTEFLLKSGETAYMSKQSTDFVYEKNRYHSVQSFGSDMPQHNESNMFEAETQNEEDGARGRHARSNVVADERSLCDSPPANNESGSLHHRPSSSSQRSVASNSVQVEKTMESSVIQALKNRFQIHKYFERQPAESSEESDSSSMGSSRTLSSNEYEDDSEDELDQQQQQRQQSGSIGSKRDKEVDDDDDKWISVDNNEKLSESQNFLKYSLNSLKRNSREKERQHHVSSSPINEFSRRKQRFRQYATIDDQQDHSLRNLDNLIGDPISNPQLLTNFKEPLIQESQQQSYFLASPLHQHQQQHSPQFSGRLTHGRKSSLRRQTSWKRSLADDMLDFDGHFHSRTRSQSDMFDEDHMVEYMSYQGTPRGSYMSPSLESDFYSLQNSKNSARHTHTSQISLNNNISANEEPRNVENEIQNDAPPRPQEQMRLIGSDRASVDDMQVDAVEDQSFRKNKRQIIILICVLIYLGISLAQFQSSDTFKVRGNMQMLMNSDETRKWLRTYGDGICRFDSNSVMINFIIYIILPSLGLRLLGLYFYKDRYSEEFADQYTNINIYFHGSYGIWTYWNVYVYMGISQSCTEVSSMSFLNYEVAIVFGLISATYVLLVGLFMLLFIPVFIYMYCKMARERVEEEESLSMLRNSLVQKRYHPQVFRFNVECSICLDEFQENPENPKKRMVTPLPCNVRHVFHTECIKSWFQEKDECPLCKQTIEPHMNEQLKKNFNSVYPMQPNAPMTR